MLDKYLGLSPAEALAWHYDPTLWRRPAQTPLTGFWRTWFLLGGRGAGKTYACSVAVIEEAMADPEALLRIVGPTDSEVRKTQLEGTSGILSLAPPWLRPHHRWGRALFRDWQGAGRCRGGGETPSGKQRTSAATSTTWNDAPGGTRTHSALGLEGR